MTFSPEVQEILDRVHSGKPKKQRAPKSGGVGVLTPAARKEELKKRAPNQPNSTSFQRVYDYKLIVALYDMEMPVQDIAEYVGCDRSTVATALNEAGIAPQERLSKVLQPKERCKRGLHLMATDAVQKGAVRTCGPCQKMVRKIARFRREGKDLTPEMLHFQTL